VDNPKAVLSEADRLVCDLMQKRGYPMGDFERCAADISVDHPAVVHHYRAAHEIALRDGRGQADTEALRQAVVHYRALFAELLEVDDAPPATTAASRPGVRDLPLPADRGKQREASH
jgi:2-hydroxychromene-2-carboxylate isomerase